MAALENVPETEIPRYGLFLTPPGMRKTNAVPTPRKDVKEGEK
jgi:hypothetical protein